MLHAIVDRMDHQFLNDIPPFDVLNPSAENMARYIYDELQRAWSGGTACACGGGEALGNRHGQRDLPARKAAAAAGSARP